MIKRQRNSLYTFTKKWFYDILWKIKEKFLKKTKLNFSVIFVSENKETWFVFDFFTTIDSLEAWINIHLSETMLLSPVSFITVSEIPNNKFISPLRIFFPFPKSLKIDGVLLKTIKNLAVMKSSNVIISMK